MRCMNRLYSCRGGYTISFHIGWGESAFANTQGDLSMKRTPSDTYLEKARLLGKKEAERLLSRMKAGLMYKMLDEALSPLECIAIQLEIENEQLLEWRAKTAELRKVESGRNLDPG